MIANLGDSRGSVRRCLCKMFFFFSHDENYYGDFSLLILIRCFRVNPLHKIRISSQLFKEFLHNSVPHLLAC